MSQRALNAYATTERETAVSSARPVDLVVLVFQRVLDHLRHGRQMMVQEEDSAVPLTKALQLINAGLQACLDRQQGGDIADNLGHLYEWASREIMLARIKKDSERITAVIEVLTTVSSAWLELASHGQDTGLAGGSAASSTISVASPRTHVAAYHQAASAV
jgi:flagellar protein FliS